MKAVAPIPMTYHILFGAMAVMVLLSMRFDSQSRFQTTPLDYLMVCLAVIFPFLPEVRSDISAFGLFVAKLIVLFFSSELLLHASRRVKKLGLVPVDLVRVESESGGRGGKVRSIRTFPDSRAGKQNETYRNHYNSGCGGRFVACGGPGSGRPSIWRAQDT